MQAPMSSVAANAKVSQINASHLLAATKKRPGADVIGPGADCWLPLDLIDLQVLWSTV